MSDKCVEQVYQVSPGSVSQSRVLACDVTLRRSGSDVCVCVCVFCLYSALRIYLV